MFNPPPLHRSRPMRTVLLASAIVAALVCAYPDTLLAQSSSQTVRQFDIPPQSLRTALERFTEQSGVRVQVPSEVSGASAAVSGER
jgi:hypothetical protein